MAHLWLRAEVFPNERRTFLLPQQAAELIGEGHTVTVERSPIRVIPDEEYEKVGCIMVEPRTYHTDAPPHAFILGFKYLEPASRFDATYPQGHNHICAMHLDNGSIDEAVGISRMEENRPYYIDTNNVIQYQSPFYELEWVSGSGGGTAGFVGAALSVYLWCREQQGIPGPHQIPMDKWDTRELLIAGVKEELGKVSEPPRVLVIGAYGKCGRQGVNALGQLGIVPEQWGSKDTEQKKGDFSQILDFDVMVNCISLRPNPPQFLTDKDLRQDSRLSVIGDVSCYPGPFSSIPLYDRTSTFDDPTIPVIKRNGTIHVMSIDNLPSLTAKAASEGLAGSLFPLLKEFLHAKDAGLPDTPDFARAAREFYRYFTNPAEIKRLGFAISQQCFRADGSFDGILAERHIRHYLERAVLTRPERENFMTYLMDGSAVTQRIRSDTALPDDPERFARMETALARINVTRICTELAYSWSVIKQLDTFMTKPVFAAIRADDDRHKAFLNVAERLVQNAAGRPARDFADVSADFTRRISGLTEKDVIEREMRAIATAGRRATRV
ncbi:MAG: hypothetical protein EB060_05390 [Proteobacteria bacterium]|nr:hypothetical protein [Pseudomonadota bacterium]